MKHAMHGGDSILAVGADFRNLQRHGRVISADILDAWYPPCPEALNAIRENLEWLVRTSPPTHSEGLRTEIAIQRGVPEESVLVGGGSSSLMFACLPLLVDQSSQVAMLEPMYGEYEHVVRNVIGAGVVKHELSPEGGFCVDLDRLADQARGNAMVILVNPNSPTGIGLKRTEVENLLAQVPLGTRVWIDETYIDFMPGAQSCETLVARFPNLIVCKSMSKFYGLSGLRIGYLVAEPGLIDRLERLTPPWSVGFLAQLAAVLALRSGDYYRTKAAETAALRTRFEEDLTATGCFQVYKGTTNFVFAEVIRGTAKEWEERCRAHELYIRNCASMGANLGDRFIRIALQEPAKQARMVSILNKVAGSS